MRDNYKNKVFILPIFKDGGFRYSLSYKALLVKGKTIYDVDGILPTRFNTVSRYFYYVLIDNEFKIMERINNSWNNFAYLTDFTNGISVVIDGGRYDSLNSDNVHKFHFLDHLNIDMETYLEMIKEMYRVIENEYMYNSLYDNIDTLLEYYSNNEKFTSLLKTINRNYIIDNIMKNE